MTAAVPADGDGVRVCRIHKRRQSFISARERNLLRPSGLWFFGFKLREPGNWTSSRGPDGTIRFPPRQGLMFSLFSIPRAGHGERAARKRLISS